MPVPRSVARVNRRIVNPVAARLAGRLPGMAVIEHTGRNSGKLYRTPVLAFKADNGFAVAVNYGVDSDWVNNLLAGKGAAVEYRGRRLPVTGSVLIEGREATGLLPRTLEPLLRRVSGDKVMKLTAG